ncbi:hypothetical protein PFISCL1PPCAC_9660, partial [Pristionchus fissidentatus]
AFSGDVVMDGIVSAQQKGERRRRALEKREDTESKAEDFARWILSFAPKDRLEKEHLLIQHVYEFARPRFPPTGLADYIRQRIDILVEEGLL